MWGNQFEERACLTQLYDFYGILHQFGTICWIQYHKTVWEWEEACSVSTDHSGVCASLSDNDYTGTPALHNTLCTMYSTQYTSAQCAGPDHTVNVQHVLSGAPVCNMLSDALLFLLCTLDNTQCNMQHALCSALLALLCNRSHGCLHPSEWR